ncbi:hypothetical protein ADUPG1_005815, partial [Aduncisulcus paluster]
MRFHPNIKSLLIRIFGDDIPPLVEVDGESNLCFLNCLSEFYIPERSKEDRALFSRALGEASKIACFLRGYIKWHDLRSEDFKSGYDELMGLSHLSQTCFVVIEETGIKAYNPGYKSVM